MAKKSDWRIIGVIYESPTHFRVELSKSKSKEILGNGNSRRASKN